MLNFDAILQKILMIFCNLCVKSLMCILTTSNGYNILTIHIIDENVI